MKGGAALESFEEQPPLGLASGTVRVVPYDSAWPALFEAEVKRLTPILTAHGAWLRLEHTGSTAVRGLAAKPILDILAGWEYHIHLTRLGSEFWDDHLTFRDHLRTHRDVAGAYAALKRELAARYPTDRERYIEAKTEFVLATLAAARDAGRSVR